VQRKEKENKMKYFPINPGWHQKYQPAHSLHIRKITLSCSNWLQCSIPFQPINLNQENHLQLH